MIPAFLLPLAAKLSPVGAILKRVPRWVWIGLAVVALVGIGVILHGRAVRKAHDAAFAQGVAAEGARIAEKARKIEQGATKIVLKVRSKNNETIHHIADDADAVRLRGPGKASCLNPAASGASGRHAPAGPADAAVDQVPDSERVDLIALPFAGTVAFAEQHDKCRADILSYREADRLLRAAWEKANPKPE